MHLFDGKAFYAGCNRYIHPTNSIHLGHNDGLNGSECLEPLACHWAQFYQQLAQNANVRGRNWFAERNPVAFSESVYDEPFARTGYGAPAIPLGDAARVPKVSGAPPAAVAAQGPPRLAGLTLLDPSGAALAGIEWEGESESSEESSVGSGHGAPSLFEAIDIASGAPPASSVQASVPKASAPSDNPWGTLTGDVSYLDPTWKRNVEAMRSQWREPFPTPAG